MKISFGNGWQNWLISFAIFAAWPALAQNARNAAGHWEGAIVLPNTSLAIKIDLKPPQPPSGQWKGSIDIPAQGLRRFQLTNLVVSDSRIQFAMPGIPGDPKFDGKLDDSGKTMRGNFSQSGQTFPFSIERKEIAAEAASETPLQGIPGQGLEGLWQGALRTGPVELRLVLKVKKGTDGKLTATLDSVDQGAADLPIDSITLEDKQVQFEMTKLNARFKGTLNEDGSEIDGKWTQGEAPLPLVFKRTQKAAQLNRPQEPKEPYPYDEETVVVENEQDEAKLSGTLTLPRSPGPHPAVLLLTGSGQQDRNETVMGHRPFLVIADHLTRQGIAVLRMDDRGIGESTGDFASAATQNFVEDALACLRFLQNHRRIDPKRIGMLGHSEGGITAPLAALKFPGTAFVVLLAAPGVPMDELLIQQGEDISRLAGMSEEKIADYRKIQRQIFTILRNEPDHTSAETRIRELTRKHLASYTEEQQAALGISDTMIEAQIKAVLTLWFRFLVSYNPRPALEQLKCPVLALNGEKDVQVAAAKNLDAIRASLEKGGNNDFKAVELKGLNHLFQHCATGAISEYSQIEETFAPEALELIGNWIRERFLKGI